jgi:hypothetical protein
VAVVDQRAVERVADVCQVVELGDEASDQRRLELLQHHAHARDGRDRLAQRYQVARAGGAERRAPDQPLDVVHRLQRVAQLDPRRAAEREVFDGVEAILDSLQRDQRTQQPCAQQPAAHRRDRAIDLLQQRSRPPAVARLDHLEVLQRGRIDEEAVGAGAEGDVADVREIRLLRVAQVLHQRAGGGDGAADRRAEALSDCAFQLREQRPRADSYSNVHGSALRLSRASVAAPSVRGRADPAGLEAATGAEHFARQAAPPSSSLTRPPPLVARRTPPP